MPALGLSSTLMTDCRCMIHWKIIILLRLVLAGVPAVQFLGDALGTAFSLLSNVGKDTFDFITSEVFSFLPKSFLAILLKLMFAI